MHVGTRKQIIRIIEEHTTAQMLIRKIEPANVPIFVDSIQFAFVQIRRMEILMKKKESARHEHVPFIT